MKKPWTFLLLVLLYLSVSLAIAQNTVVSAPDGAGATTIFRQVMPDGRVVYSDTIIKGVKVDRILLVPGAGASQVAAKPDIGDRSRSSGNNGAASGSSAVGR